MDSIEIPEIVALTCWYLWWQRREIIKGEQVQTTCHTAMAIQAMTLNFVRAASKPNPAPRLNIWKKPLSEFQVLNVDASFSEGNYMGSCGMVVRDHNG